MTAGGEGRLGERDGFADAGADGADMSTTAVSAARALRRVKRAGDATSITSTAARNRDGDSKVRVADDR